MEQAPNRNLRQGTVVRRGTVVLDRTVLDSAIARQLITLGELADRAGVTKATVWHARTGKRVTLSVARKLASVLRIPLRTLVAGATDESDQTVVAV